MLELLEQDDAGRSEVPPATIAVIGAGAWGTALAHTLARAGRTVRLHARDPALGARIARERRNPAHLPGVSLDPRFTVHDRLEDCVPGADLVILAVPTHGMRETAERAASHIEPGATVISAAKGFELPSRLTMSAVLVEVLGRPAAPRVTALSGPNIAIEIARGLPAATVVAGREARATACAQRLLGSSQLRVYTNDDVTGVELAGALKNVVAIAAGICDGVGAGDNGKAALITRGLAEMARMGVTIGARPLTFAGLAGLGDTVVTCASPHSRNRRLGEAIGRGQTLAEVQAGMFQVAEGVNTARAARDLAAERGIEMPIVAEVCAVLFDAKPLHEALGDLMRRGARDELSEFGLDGGTGAIEER